MRSAQMSLLHATLLGLMLQTAPAVAATLSPPTLSPPGEAIEVLTPDQPLPYLSLLPEMQVENFRIDGNAVDFLPLPERQGTLGPGPLRLDYVFTGKAHRGPRQVLELYRKALLQTGWTANAVPGAAAIVVARYLKNGRYLWLKLQADAKALHVTVWEPAAHVQAAVLRDALEKKGSAVIYGIAFELNKEYLRPEAVPILRQILTLLQESPALKLQIQVHSDDAFRNVYARRPTYARAKTLVQWLIEHGIDANRLTAQGYDAEKPVDSNKTPEGRARNRRVELVKLP